MSDLDAILNVCREAEGLAEKATKGPWKSKINHPPYKVVWISKKENYCTLELKSEDADFIAHSRTLLPALAKALTEAAGDIEWLIAELELKSYDLDSYGVPGSDFYICPYCQGESGAGMLNTGVVHGPECELGKRLSALSRIAAILNQPKP